MFSNKKVLIITNTDRMISMFLLPHIKQLQEAGNIVECACNKSGPWFDELINMGLTVHQISFSRNPFSLNNLKSLKNIYKLCKDNNYDLIHCHTPIGGFIGRLAGKKYKIPTLYIAHGFHFYKGAPIINHVLYKNLEKYCAKYTDALVTMNQEDYESAKKMKAKKVYLINGIGYDQAKTFSGDFSSLKQELNIKNNDTVLISVGELNKNKNHIAVLKALKNLNNKNIKYLICGRGPKQEEYEKYIKENNLQATVKLLGFRKDIPQILAASNIFIMPSKREGLPVSIMEAMSSGLPVIASDIRGCRDLITHNENGLLVNLKDKKGFENAINKLINEKELIETFSKNCRIKIEKFYLPNVLMQMGKIYSEINFNK